MKKVTIWKKPNREIKVIFLGKGESTPIHDHGGSEITSFPIWGKAKEERFEEKPIDDQISKLNKLGWKVLSWGKTDKGIIHRVTGLSKRSVILNISDSPVKMREFKKTPEKDVYRVVKEK